MRKCLLLAAASAAVCGSTIASRAAPPPAYGFETLYNNANPPQPDPSGTRPDGFHANGGGTTISQSTVGVTQGSFSMQFSQVLGATFTGAQTNLLTPISQINDPITTGVTFDITIPATAAFSGNFARIGMTEFGFNTAGNFPGDAQTIADSEQNIALAPGTYTLTIPLIARTHPATFEPDVPFSTIFKNDGDPNNMVPIGIQFYINKSADSALNVYIDNVHVNPDFLFGDANLDNKVDLTDFTILAAHFNQATGQTWFTADFSGNGGVDLTDFTYLASNFNKIRGQAAAASVVPEPAGLAAGIALAVSSSLRRRRGGEAKRSAGATQR